MGGQETLFFGVAIALSVVPFVLQTYLLLRRNEHLTVTGWRRWLAITGLALGWGATLPSLLFYLVLELPSNMKETRLPMIAGAMPAALIAGLLALVLLAFGKGRARWLALLADVVCVGLLYFTLLGLSD
ncbi:MAG: hypothetical protein KGK08_03770 [Acidobacteriota bacterium]|nr:hypothetical protein [Acidobacteriota bacterium]